MARLVLEIGGFMTYLLFYTKGLGWFGDIGDFMAFIDLMEDDGLMDELGLREDLIISAVVSFWLGFKSLTGLS